MLKFYRPFCPAQASHLGPLNVATEGKENTSKIEQTPAFIAAYKATRQAIADTVLLVHPEPDTKTQVSIYTSGSAQRV